MPFRFRPVAGRGPLPGQWRTRHEPQLGHSRASSSGQDRCIHHCITSDACGRWRSAPTVPAIHKPGQGGLIDRHAQETMPYGPASIIACFSGSMRVRVSPSAQQSATRGASLLPASAELRKVHSSWRKASQSRCLPQQGLPGLRKCDHQRLVRIVEFGIEPLVFDRVALHQGSGDAVRCLLAMIIGLAG